MRRHFLPTEIITGCGCVSEVGRVSARYGDRVMVVSGRTFARRSGLLQRVTQLAQAEGLIVTTYDSVRGEAELPVVEAGIALARQENCQVFVGLGGGSAIDTAKAVAGLVNLPGSVWEYHEGRPLEGPGAPLVAVPTTAGTGAEVTKNAVLIDPRKQVKRSIRDDGWFARVALVDPETTLSMPPEVTASTGADALCQAIEAFTSIGASAVTDALAMRAIELVGRSLLRAYRAGQDITAREEMSLASLMAGMAMANARLGAVHGMAHPLGAHYGISHGLVCGLLLPYTMAYNLTHAIDKYAVVARLLGENVEGLGRDAAALRAVSRVRELLTEIGLPTHLSDFGVTEDGFDVIIAESLPSGSFKHNPRPLQAEDARRILMDAL
jgi:alcohol dehydrogenase class IV